MFKDKSEVRKLEERDRVFTPKMDPALRDSYLKKWHKAVRMCEGWEDDSKA
jgi:glycerol kinase